MKKATRHEQGKDVHVVSLSKEKSFCLRITRIITLQRKHDTSLQQIEKIQHTVRKVQITGKKYHTNCQLAMRKLLRS
jgi:hypothetical protein